MDDVLERDVFLVVLQESGSTSVLMDSWNKSGKTGRKLLSHVFKMYF